MDHIDDSNGNEMDKQGQGRNTSPVSPAASIAAAENMISDPQAALQNSQLEDQATQCVINDKRIENDNQGKACIKRLEEKSQQQQQQQQQHEGHYWGQALQYLDQTIQVCSPYHNLSASAEEVTLELNICDVLRE